MVEGKNNDGGCGFCYILSDRVLFGESKVMDHNDPDFVELQNAISDHDAKLGMLKSASDNQYQQMQALEARISALEARVSIPSSVQVVAPPIWVHPPMPWGSPRPWGGGPWKR